MATKFSFKQSYNITIRDINYANHMDHLALLNYLHETRVRLLRSLNVSELDVDNQGSGLVVTELSCKYRKECFYGDLIDIEVQLEQLSNTRLNFVYQISRDGVIIANSVITTAFISKAKKVIPIPPNLLIL
jgi:YbgC/YbaW family acyl-CoA thioester hydrolase